MNITFYGLSKKKNSTKQPAAGATSWSVTGTLKDPCSITHPVVRIKRTSGDYAPVYTYAYIAKFARYYFVEDVRWVEPFWEISMSVDVLASFKSVIGTSSHYVLRTDSTTDFNELISDGAYPATNNFSLYQISAPNCFTNYLSAGCYVVGIISNSTRKTVGAISYYALTQAQFGQLKEQLLSDSNLEVMGIIDPQDHTTPLITDMSPQLLKAMYNPFQYIVSCMWFPFGVTSITNKASVSTINIGWWPYSITGYSIGIDNILISESGLPIHAHPLAATRGKYLNYAPYTRCTMYGRFGTLPLDLSYFGDDSNTMTVSYFIDVITGQCRATVETYDSSATTPSYNKVAETYFQLGVPIQLAQIASDYLGAAVTAVGAAADTASKALKLDFGGAISSAASGIYNTLNAAMPQMATSGANGSLIVAGTQTTLVFQHFDIVDEDISHKGRPLCEIKQINTLSGYILCADGEFDISCFDDERTQIVDYLTSGFFWE